MPHSLSRLKHSSMIFFIIVQMFTWVLCIPQNFLRNLFLGETCLWPFLNTSREFYNTDPSSDDKRDMEETMINCKSRTLQKFRNAAKNWLDFLGSRWFEAFEAKARQEKLLLPVWMRTRNKKISPQWKNGFPGRGSAAIKALKCHVKHFSLWGLC